MKKQQLNTGDKDPKSIKNTEDENSLKNTTNSKRVEEDEEDDDGYTILPSNDSGITADDNAATGRMHEKEGE